MPLGGLISGNLERDGILLAMQARVSQGMTDRVAALLAELIDAARREEWRKFSRNRPFALNTKMLTEERECMAYYEVALVAPRQARFC